MLNFDLRRRCGIDTIPFKRVEFKDSKRCELIQLCDPLVGSLGFRQNRREIYTVLAN
jgi:hypothetical protein